MNMIKVQRILIAALDPSAWLKIRSKSGLS